MMIIVKFSLPVNFDLSFLKIRWSDHLFVKVKNKIIGEGVVYGGNWKKAERLARQMAEMKFGAMQNGLPVCEQLFIESAPAVRFPLPWSTPAPLRVRGRLSTRRGDATAGFGCDSYFLLKQKIGPIRKRGSNLKLKVGRNVIEDIKVIKLIRNQLGFPNQIRIDANQGYSLKQLQYLIPALKEAGIKYVEEPVKKKDLQKAIKILHKNGLKIILDESLNNINLISVINIIDAINIKLSRIGDIKKALQLIKLVKKYDIKAVIGCSEELERGMKAIYALGQIAKKAGVLLEIEGFGPLRLSASRRMAQGKLSSIPRWVNKPENLNLILGHRIRQIIFDLWWQSARLVILAIKKTKFLSAISLRLVKITGKSKYPIHPKHLIKNTSEANFLKYIGKKDIVLDVGCGNGQNAIKAAMKAGKVFGFDTDEQMLNIAQKTSLFNKIEKITEFKNASAEKSFPYKNNVFDKVMFLGVLEHLIDRDSAMKEVYRVLKDNGKLILGIPNSNTEWKITQRRFGINSITDPDHKIEYDKQQIEEMLIMNNFRIEKLLPTAYDTPWAGIIDVIGGISLQLYEKLIKWKWDMAKKHPEESISYLVVAQKV